MNGTLTRFIDLGYRVNYNQLVDSCCLEFEVNGEKYYTYRLTKTFHHSSNLGKILKQLLGRNVKAAEHPFDASPLVGTKVYLTVENYKVTGVEAAL